MVFASLLRKAISAAAIPNVLKLAAASAWPLTLSNGEHSRTIVIDSDLPGCSDTTALEIVVFEPERDGTSVLTAQQSAQRINDGIMITIPGRNFCVHGEQDFFGGGRGVGR